MATDRIALARLPTPLEFSERLTAAWGGPQIWIKRDDLTGFGLSGNKVRKLEYHFHAAIAAGATSVVTCGAIQSNHCRATAIAAARLGLRCVLFLRTADGEPPDEPTGNHLLHRLAGADCRFITPDGYTHRDEIMASAAVEIGDAWVIPEGASDALGARGYVAAAHELAGQLPAGLDGITIWHAASSAGTTAGLVRGVAETGIDATILGCSVGDPAADIAAHVVHILGGTVPDGVRWSITDAYVGGGYGMAARDELLLQSAVSRLTGLIFDPTYTGKAIYGLAQEINAGVFDRDETVIFLHTGGGFAVFAQDWPDVLSTVVG